MLSSATSQGGFARQPVRLCTINSVWAAAPAVLKLKLDCEFPSRPERHRDNVLSSNTGCWATVVSGNMMPVCLGELAIHRAASVQRELGSVQCVVAGVPYSVLPLGGRGVL